MSAIPGGEVVEAIALMRQEQISGKGIRSHSECVAWEKVCGIYGNAARIAKEHKGKMRCRVLQERGPEIRPSATDQ